MAVARSLLKYGRLKRSNGIYSQSRCRMRRGNRRKCRERLRSIV